MKFEPLWAANAMVLSLRNDWAGNTVTRPGQLNLGVRWFGADLEGGNLAGRMKNKRLVISLY